MKARIIEHLIGQQKSQIVVAKDIVYMLASSSTFSSKKGLQKFLG
jgi:hypothetical protein